jgi:nitrate/nitrite transporter NarK
MLDKVLDSQCTFITLIILVVFSILCFGLTLLIQAKDKKKQVLDLTLKEIFQKRTWIITLLLIIVPSPILFLYLLYILKRKQHAKNENP